MNLSCGKGGEGCVGFGKRDEGTTNRPYVAPQSHDYSFYPTFTITSQLLTITLHPMANYTKTNANSKGVLRILVTKTDPYKWPWKKKNWEWAKLRRENATLNHFTIYRKCQKRQNMGIWPNFLWYVIKRNAKSHWIVNVYLFKLLSTDLVIGF